MMNSEYVRNINNICTNTYNVYYNVNVYIIKNLYKK